MPALQRAKVKQRPPKRRCKGKSVRTGKRCGCPPLKDSEYCRAHDESLPEEQRWGSPTWSAAAGASAKPHIPKVLERITQQVDEHADKLVAAYINALDAERMVVVGTGPNAFTQQEPDHNVRMAGAEKLLNRLYGNPKAQAAPTGENHLYLVAQQIITMPPVRAAARDLVTAAAKARQDDFDGVAV